jgi:hypothetical protein
MACGFRFLSQLQNRSKDARSKRAAPAGLTPQVV